MTLVPLIPVPGVIILLLKTWKPPFEVPKLIAGDAWNVALVWVMLQPVMRVLDAPLVSIP